VQGNIEDMTILAFEPGGHSAQLVMMFEEQYRISLAGEDVGRGHACQTTADHNDIIFVLSVFQKIFGHNNSASY